MDLPETACMMPRAVKAPNPALDNETRTMVNAPTRPNICAGDPSVDAPKHRPLCEWLI
jgi:hypothetical protein